MKNLYERVIELLGKTQEDPAFTEFARALEDDPELFLKTKARTEYIFKKSGLLLSFLECANCFGNLIFDGRKNHDSRYTGNFPAGIEFGDNRDVVEMKLGVKLMYDGSTKTSDQYMYELQNVRLTFFFHKLTGELYLVDAAYIPAWDLW